MWGRIDMTADTLKHGGDVLAMSGAIATFFGWLPNITALFALIYLLIRIWETNTVQLLLGRARAK